MIWVLPLPFAEGVVVDGCFLAPAHYGREMIMEEFVKNDVRDDPFGDSRAIENGVDSNDPTPSVEATESDTF